MTQTLSCVRCSEGRDAVALGGNWGDLWVGIHSFLVAWIRSFNLEV